MRELDCGQAPLELLRANSLLPASGLRSWKAMRSPTKDLTALQGWGGVQSDAETRLDSTNCLNSLQKRSSEKRSALRRQVSGRNSHSCCSNS